MLDKQYLAYLSVGFRASGIKIFPVSHYKQPARQLVIQHDKNVPGKNTALLFRLEHNRGLEDVQKLIQTVYNCTDGPQYRELRRAFVSWTRHVLLPRALPQVQVPPVDDLLEITEMLADQSRSWTHQWKMEGVQEGELTLLKRLLTRKFGPLPDDIAQRLKTATSAQLETWSLNILDASTLDDVFRE